MQKVLLQLDSSRLASVFDQIVAYDAGADVIMSYAGVTEGDVRDLIHGCIFTRPPKDLKNTAVWIGGNNMSAGEQLLAMAQDSVFGPFKVSMMLDSNGSNTTAVAAVMKLQHAVGSFAGRSALITAGSGPVGTRAAGLMAKAGADVTITTRRTTGGTVATQIQQRFGGTVHELTMADASGAAKALDGAEVLLNAGAASVCMVPKDAWHARSSLKAAADINAVPPLGIEGIDVMDNGADRDGVVAFGALGVGNLKMKIHKACIARLFEKNDQVLDVESISDIALELMKK